MVAVHGVFCLPPGFLLAGGCAGAGLSTAAAARGLGWLHTQRGAAAKTRRGTNNLMLASQTCMATLPQTSIGVLL
jgi:hypothetical protein